MKKRILKYTLIIIGLLLIVGIGVFIGSRYFGNEAEIQNNNAEVSEDARRIAAVGDSITDGMLSMREISTSYPDRLNEKLGENYVVKNFGESNYSTQSDADFSYETTSSFEESLVFEPDIVLFMLGTNDTKPINWNGAEAFKEDYENLLGEYQELESDPRMILMSPPPLFIGEAMTEGSINPANIEEVREVVVEVAEEQDLEFIDIYNQLDQEEWFTDGIHPNDAGAERLAEIIYEYLNE